MMRRQQASRLAEIPDPVRNQRWSARCFDILATYTYTRLRGTGSGDSAFTRTLEERYEFYVSIIFCYLLSFAICDGNPCGGWVMFSQAQQ